MTGPGSDLSEVSVWGCEPAALDVSVAPRCPPGPVACGGDEVVEHGPVDDVGESPFEAAHGFVRGLPGGDFPVVVGAAFGGRVRSWTTAMMCSTMLICRFPPRESRWRTLSPEDASIGGGAGPGREVATVGEPGDVADLDQQPGGTGGADAVQVEQRRCRCHRQVDEFLVRGLLALVDPLEVDDQLERDPLSGLAHRRLWVGPSASSLRAWAADRSFFAPPGISSSSSWWS